MEGRMRLMRKRTLFWLAVQMELRTFRLVARMLQAKAPEERAAVDLDTHFSEVSGTGSCVACLL